MKNQMLMNWIIKIDEKMRARKNCEREKVREKKKDNFPEDDRLTVGQNIDSLIVEEENAANTVCRGHKWSVPFSNMGIKLQMFWHIIPTFEQDLI